MQHRRMRLLRKKHGITTRELSRYSNISQQRLSQIELGEGISLISTQADVPVCHIYVMDAADAGAYFSLFHGDSGSYFCR